MFRIFNKFFERKEKMSFEEIANEWLETKRLVVKESTYYHYITVVEKHLKPYFKDKPILNELDYNDLIQQLTQELAPKTVRDIITILKSILRYYEEEYKKVLNIKKSNIPKLEKEEIQPLTKKERKKLENYCLENKNLKNIGILICLNTGLRIGEICGLKWENIDLENRKIYVRYTVERIYDKRTCKSKVIICTPKSQSSIRAIPISKKLYDVLKPLKKLYKSNDFFLSGNEKYVEPRSYQYTYDSLLKSLKIKSYKFHILRHTFATDCINVGMSTKSLSEILGHSDISITLRIYVHSSYKQQKKYLEKI